MLAIFAIILILIGIGLRWYGTKYEKGNDTRWGLNLGSIVIFGLGAMIFTFECFTQVDKGHVGVKDRFGVVSEETIPPGIHGVDPFADVIEMNVQTWELKQTMTVPSSEGLNIGVDISLLARLDAANADDIYREVFDNYVNTIVLPQFRAVVRRVTARYEAKILYSEKRETLGIEIAEELRTVIGHRGVYVESTPLRDLELPVQLTKAIEDKAESEQEAEKMKFVILREEQEADRKSIEAKGIHNFQRIVQQGITPSLLKWKGIEATIELAKSNNTKVVIVGAGKDGLPLILGSQ